MSRGSRSLSPATRTIRKNGLAFSVVAAQNADFWRLLETDAWEPRTFAIIDRFVSSDCVYVDVGAWIGPTLLYAAQRAEAAYGFEPDPVAFAALSRNVTSNVDEPWCRRIEIRQQVVGHEAGTVRLGNESNAGDSTTSALLADARTAWDVERISLADFFVQKDLMRAKLFVKMDIEGGEYDLLPHLRNLLANPRLVLHLSIHPWILAKSLQSDRSFSGTSLRVRARRRLCLVAHHRRLLRALPFRHIYRDDGRAIMRTSETLQALSAGEYVTTLVGTHEPW